MISGYDASLFIATCALVALVILAFALACDDAGPKSKNRWS